MHRLHEVVYPLYRGLPNINMSDINVRTHYLMYSWISYLIYPLHARTSDWILTTPPAVYHACSSEGGGGGGGGASSQSRRHVSQGVGWESQHHLGVLSTLGNCNMYDHIPTGQHIIPSPRTSARFFYIFFWQVNVYPAYGTTHDTPRTRRSNV